MPTTVTGLGGTVNSVQDACETIGGERLSRNTGAARACGQVRGGPATVAGLATGSQDIDIRATGPAARWSELSAGADTCRVKGPMVVIAGPDQFPFSAVVGMDDMRLALILNAISPSIGGVLVRGEKGTAKSTTVRALTAILPPVEVISGCRFSCSPVTPDPRCPDGPHQPDTAGESRPARLVELPVGATDDRLTGSLDVERALTEGVTSFQPGLLAQAHCGVLYVDEVNLLHDHLVDLLLDSAALGTNYVERDGVSVRHAARFLLVGTMNPEEGELRPQLLDRFGLTVEVAAPREPEVRAEVVRRRLAFDADPVVFVAKYATEEAELAEAIAKAQALLGSVVLGDDELAQIATVCATFDVDGLRADIVIARTAAAHAAWRGVGEVEREDVRVAARLALPHRRRRNPFDAPGLSDDDEQRLDDALGPDPDDEPDPEPPGGSDPGAQDAQASRDGADPAGQPAGEVSAGSGGAESVVGSGATFRTHRLEVPGKGSGDSGHRSRAYTDGGRTIGARVPSGPARDVHLISTLSAAAPHQHQRGRRGGAGGGLILYREDLRERRREGRESNLVLFAVDASGSMAARQRMASVKGAVLSLLLDAYQRRDKVGLIAFRGTAAELLLPPTSSVDAAATRLESLPTGGRTPLASGLLEVRATLIRERLRDPDRRPLVVVVTDGRHTAGPDPQAAAGLLQRDRIASVVVDCESGPIRLGLAAALAQALGAACLRPEQLSAEGLTGVVRSYRSEGRAA
jgi:magnesium chelatase subunit D